MTEARLAHSACYNSLSARRKLLGRDRPKERPPPTQPKNSPTHAIPYFHQPKGSSPKRNYPVRLVKLPSCIDSTRNALPPSTTRPLAKSSRFPVLTVVCPVGLAALSRLESNPGLSCPTAYEPPPQGHIRGNLLDAVAKTPTGVRSQAVFLS